jgi:hypothetical protein
MTRFFNQAKSGLGLNNSDMSPEQRRRQENKRGKMLEDFANRIMERRTGGMVAGIANAAQQSNAWIFTGPSTTSFEVFLIGSAAKVNVTALGAVVRDAPSKGVVDRNSSWAAAGPAPMRISATASAATINAADFFM